MVGDPSGGDVVRFWCSEDFGSVLARRVHTASTEFCFWYLCRCSGGQRQCVSLFQPLQSPQVVCHETFWGFSDSVSILCVFAGRCGSFIRANCRKIRVFSLWGARNVAWMVSRPLEYHFKTAWTVSRPLRFHIKTAWMVSRPLEYHFEIVWMVSRSLPMLN